MAPAGTCRVGGVLSPAEKSNVQILLYLAEFVLQKHDPRQVGWSKAVELTRVVHKDREAFGSATWLHKAKNLPKESFKSEVERHLTGRETEPWEILYFKVCKSQLPIVEKALETAGLMLGGDKSRGYCLEMICADFLAGANLWQNGMSLDE
jgi:hypothetical protein